MTKCRQKDNSLTQYFAFISKTVELRGKGVSDDPSAFENDVKLSSMRHLSSLFAICRNRTRKHPRSKDVTI